MWVALWKVDQSGRIDHRDEWIQPMNKCRGWLIEIHGWRTCLILSEEIDTVQSCITTLIGKTSGLFSILDKFNLPLTISNDIDHAMTQSRTFMKKGKGGI